MVDRVTFRRIADEHGPDAARRIAVETIRDQINDYVLAPTTTADDATRFLLDVQAEATRMIRETALGKDSLQQELNRLRTTTTGELR